MIRTLFVIGITLLGTASALAWDTKERPGKAAHERDNWLAIYRCYNGGDSECPRNEHEQISNIALGMAVQNNVWGIGGRTGFTAIDLNASLFRPELADLDRLPASSSNGRPLEERVLPAPPHFAGIPDYSYTIYDWVNKNELCPAMPANQPIPDHCHVYSEYHGAIFNSSHFGTQAAMSYQRLHQTALSLARQAAVMLDATASDEERAAHADAIREAELLALAYEGYAQHFLADRWAMGHMFERWGAPEYVPGYGQDAEGGRLAGALTGLIHGYESVAHEYSPVDIPDAMSSPELEETGWFSGPQMYTSQWVFASGGEPSNGVGDYRLQDMQDGAFGREYSWLGNIDYPINVRTQEQWMMRCLSAGFGEVVRGFGSHPDGGYGIDNAQLTAAGQGSLEGECFSPWATNFAMDVGWGTEGQVVGGLLSILNGGQLARYAIRMFGADSTTEAVVGGVVTYLDRANAQQERADLVRLAANMKYYAYMKPNGTEMAQGGLGSLGRIRTSDRYALASYLEPASLDSLPDSDARGRDLESVYGLFNRAGAEYFCQRGEELLDKYRRSGVAEERAACRILAQRMYATTWDGYNGPQRETQSVRFAENRAEVRPLCEIAGGWTPPSGRDEDSPYRLHPGYVPWPTSGARGAPYQADEWQLSNQSIANWCDGVPVVDLLEEEEDLARDIVARVSDPAKKITLKGLDFGRDEGVLKIGQNPASAVEVTDIDYWGNREIEFALGDLFDQISFNAEREAFIFIERKVIEGEVQQGLTSTGRFVLLDDIPRPEVKSVRIYRRGETFMEYARVEELEDPGAFADDLPPPEEPGAFRPIDPGTVTVEVEFDRAMDRDAEETAFMLGGDSLIGEWRGRTTWRGSMDLLGGDFFRRRIGFQTLSVKAKADDGGWLDAAPDQAGDQPFTDLRVMIDMIPAYVAKIDVRGPRGSTYAAEWIGGPDLAEEPNITSRVLNDPARSLSVTARRTPPAEGEGEIRLELSGPVPEAPAVTIGPVTVEMTMAGAEQRWRGSFDYAALAGHEQDGRIPIRITLTDDAGKGADGDPRTVTQINPETTNNAYRWQRYEVGRGKGDGASGGTDDWHFLAAPVDQSLMIILDASGSMGRGTGRMEKAKEGIIQTLDSLPEDKVIEVAGTIFLDCGQITTKPFTRDINAMKEFLLAVQPTGGTDLAASHRIAGTVFDGSADPSSPDWRYATFTDGEESCGGNVAGDARALSAKLREHQGALRRQEPEAPPAPEPLEQVECRPATWHAYRAEVTPREPLDDITLIEHWYMERALPDGRCFVRLETRRYGVYYGSGGAGSGWGVNSRPSKTSSDFGTSSKGVADLDRVRNQANSLRRNATSLDDARRQIADTVRRELGGS